MEKESLNYRTEYFKALRVILGNSMLTMIISGLVFLIGVLFVQKKIIATIVVILGGLLFIVSSVTNYKAITRIKEFRSLRNGKEI